MKNGKRSTGISARLYSVNRLVGSKLREGNLAWDKTNQNWYYRNSAGAIKAINFLSTGAVGTSELANTLDLTAKDVSFSIKSGTPVNAVAADDIILTFTDGSTDGEYFEFGNDLFEIDIDAGGTAQAGAIAVDLVTGSVAKEDAGAAFKISFDASATENWTAVDNLDGTVTLSALTAGVINNGLATSDRDAAHAEFDTRLSGNGVDGTVGAAREILADATNIYMATAANTIADANWKKLTLLSL